MRRTRTIAATISRWVVLSFLFLVPVHAQVGAIGNTTSTPVPGVPHDYIAGLNETVNPANGSVSVRLAASWPRERGVNDPVYAYTYDSSGWYTLTPTWTTVYTGPRSEQPFTYPEYLTYAPPPNGLSVPGTLDFQQATQSVQIQTGQNTFQTYTCTVNSGYVYTDPDGGRHGLGIAFGQDVTPNPGACAQIGFTNYYYQGGDLRYKYIYGGNVIDTHGNAVDTTDVNGNAINKTTGRTSTGTPGIFGNAIYSQNGATWTPPGVNGSYSYSQQTANVSFSLSLYKVSQDSAGGGCGAIAGIIPYPTFGASGVPPQNVVFDPVHVLTLPNGQHYTFDYDPALGLLSKITYPTGATVEYTWSIIPKAEGAKYYSYGPAGGVNCAIQYDWFAITKRVVKPDGVTAAEEDDFSYQTVWPASPSYQWTSKSTTVTTKDLVRGTSFNTVYNYAPYQPPLSSPSMTNELGFMPQESSIAYYNTDGSLLKTVYKSWGTIDQLAAECTQLPTGQISGRFYQYKDYAPLSYANTGKYVLNSAALSTDLVTDLAEYDYGAITTPCVQPSTAPTRETVTTYASFGDTPLFNGHAPIQDRPATFKVYGLVNGSQTLVQETDYAYDETTVAAVTPAPYGHNETNYGAASTVPRGNPTTVTKKCFVGSQNCTNSVTKYTYDTTGQVLTVQDANNNVTSYSYADNFSTDNGSPSQNTNVYVTKFTRPVTNGVPHVTSFQYGFGDGKLRLVTDENNLQTKYCYETSGCAGTAFDPFFRLTESDNPDGGRTSFSYNDAGLSPSVTTVRKINSTQSLTTVSIDDGLGRLKQTQLTSDPQGTIFADTTYDGLSRVWKQSNPYRSGTDPTTSSGTTTFAYDALGRKVSTTYPDGSIATTAYCGPSTLATDPAGKWRRSRTDGLGRLVEVDEPNAVGAVVASTGCPGSGEPIWVTSYGYDTLGNLTSVLQNGSHARSFTYDSLSRLLTSANPEVGTIAYTYDANSNVSTKKDARNITTSYTYDALNREKTTTYSNGDATVTTNYDESNCLGLSACQNVGHATSMTDAAGTEAWSYQIDPGNSRSVHVNQRTTNSIAKSSTYYLDLAGNVTKMVYPTGRTVNYAYDSANRPVQAVDGSTGTIYANSPLTPPSGCLSNAVCYTPQGTAYSMSVGQSSSFSGLNITESFNNRLQPAEIKASSTAGNAMDISYNYVDPVSGKNAGHVYGITNNLDALRSQTFGYDQLNRITSAQTTSTYSTASAKCWGESYNLDAWGNLLSIAATTNSAYTGCLQESGFTQNADGNNHLTGFSYDASGNTAKDTVYQMYWNAESQLTYTTGGATYVYDGAGRRVYKSGGNEPKIYWYGSGGEILSETNPSGYLVNDYIYFGGKRIAAVPNDLNLNGGFEQGLQGWSMAGSGSATAVNNPANAHSGNYYAEITTPVNSATTVTTTQPISGYKGEILYSTAWVYHETGTDGYTRWWLSVQGTNGTISSHAVDNSTMNAWIFQTNSVTIPLWLEGPYTVTVYAQVSTTSTTQSASGRFDDVTLNGNTQFFVSDSLGTARLITDASGSVCYDADFYPYGGERTPYTSTCTSVYKFEGKERDTETGNDDFGARYYSNRFGRWLSADWSAVPVAVPYANLTNPQTLNLYAMVADDPETSADLDGHDGITEVLVPILIEIGISNPIGAVAAVGTAVSIGLAGQAREPASYVPGGLTDEKGNSVFSSQYRNSLKQSSANSGSGGEQQSGGMQPKEGETGGPGAGKDFSEKTKEQAVQENKAANGGETKCVFCGEKTGPGTNNKTNIDHAQAKANRGNNTSKNAQVTCEYCNKSKGTGQAPKNPKKPDGN